jgi:1,4-dihydroxy-6-naphthoate synthase
MPLGEKMTMRNITVAHSPDSDDAFMFYALAHGQLDIGDLTFTHTLEDIETLNRKAFREEYDVTAVSFHAYAYIAEKYALLSSGASMGDRYGPMVVAARRLEAGDLRRKTIAIPGTMTTAYLTLKLYEPDIETQVVPFDQILDVVAAGSADAGLIIHEGQLTYQTKGLHKVLDLGEWWHEQTQLPLPLGGNAIRRSLGPDLSSRIAKLLRQSIQYALEHREDALAYALQFARGMDPALADRFVGMYVNERTVAYGQPEREAIRRLLTLGYERGIIPHRVDVEFVE